MTRLQQILSRAEAAGSIYPAHAFAEYQAAREDFDANVFEDIGWMAERINALEALALELAKGLDAVEDLIGDSYGVAGLHLNDDVAPWSDLREGGHFEDWLRDFDAALSSPLLAELRAKEAGR